MLRFIKNCVNKSSNTLRISIHPMLRFIDQQSIVNVDCYRNFNTSHVTVYRSPVFSSYWFVNISIHPMLRFIKKEAQTAGKKFHFNTSHVTVYLYVRYNQTECVYNFNTSHVTVYLILKRKTEPILSNFNTSHVTVYHPFSITQ